MCNQTTVMQVKKYYSHHTGIQGGINAQCGGLCSPLSTPKCKSQMSPDNTLPPPAPRPSQEGSAGPFTYFSNLSPGMEDHSGCRQYRQCEPREASVTVVHRLSTVTSDPPTPCKTKIPIIYKRICMPSNKKENTTGTHNHMGEPQMHCAN